MFGRAERIRSEAVVGYGGYHFGIGAQSVAGRRFAGAIQAGLPALARVFARATVM